MKRVTIGLIVIFFIIAMGTVTANSKHEEVSNVDEIETTMSTDYMDGFLEGKAIYDAIEYSKMAFEDQFVPFSREDFDEFQLATQEFMQEILDDSIKVETINHYNSAIIKVPNSKECLVKSENYQAWKDSIQYSYYSKEIYTKYQSGEISEKEFDNWQTKEIEMLDNLSHDRVIASLKFAETLV